MKNNSLPFVVAKTVVDNKNTTFYTNREKLVVEAPKKLMEQIIALCDGTVTYKELIKLLSQKWEASAVRSLLKILCGKGVVLDARSLGESAWNLIENPSLFPLSSPGVDAVALAKKARDRQHSGPSEKVYRAGSSGIKNLLDRRESVRSFSNEAIDFQSLIDVLWGAYGEVSREGGEAHKTVPSAGALYPLTVHVVLFKKTGELEPAIYKVYLGDPGSVGFHVVSSDTNRFARSFLDPMVLEKAAGTVVVSGSFGINGEKYGNRSLLYVSLEAGHVAQNIHLMATEQNIATVEIGGFLDTPLAKAVELPQGFHPLTTVVFGKKAEPLEGSGGLTIEWAIPTNDRYRPHFAIASARVSDKRSWSHGRDESPFLAQTKAVAEAKEWASCGNVPQDLVKAPFSDLEGAVDPRSVLEFHQSQYCLAGFPFSPFDPKQEYEWTKAYKEETGSETRVLADLVYFPYFPGRQYYCYANSSGVAAHPDRQKAVETSTLELVERDSFMIAYMTRIQSPSVSKKTLPEEIQIRVKHLERAGFRVWVKDHSLGLAPAVFVFAQSEELGCTTCASCSSFSVEHAVDHALMEVEAFVSARLQNGPLRPVEPREVGTPLDHGALYDQRKYFHKADFLVGGSSTVSFKNVGSNSAKSWQDLILRFRGRGWNLFTVPLSLTDQFGGSKDLHIIRSIVPGMIPMTFGYRQEPAGMKRVYAIAEEFGQRNPSYKELTKFPHPFA